MFAHCRAPEEVWATYHAVACLCHPAQGGHVDDVRALTADARARLGDLWPADWGDVPNLFDIFCAATRTPNPFGASIRPGADAPAAPGADMPLRGYEPAGPAPFGDRGAGRVLAVFRAPGSDEYYVRGSVPCCSGSSP